MHHLRFRHVHLDFHTSGEIPDIGTSFNKEEWQQTLCKAHVNAITLFAKCHHGWHYHVTTKGHLHPQLRFDLLRAQFDACKEKDINVTLYLSAGLDNLALDEHPEWQCEFIDPMTLKTYVDSNLLPGFHHVCFNSPYTEYLCEQIRETIHLFPDCNGIFLDIVSQPECCCKHCLKVMAERGLNPQVQQDRQKCAQIALERYYSMTTQAARDEHPNMPIFHNSGHISPEQIHQYKKYFSHLELESLPTGGWGYDHFPQSAKYAKTLQLDFSGMTGKFHTTWGEFGGLKHPNALLYECSAMLAFGAKCSIGDQLHPSGKLDQSTYRIIGQAYQDVEKKEPWCENTHNMADIGLLTKAAVSNSTQKDIPGDIGAGRLLLEGHFLFDVIDTGANFCNYPMLILPDDVSVDNTLKQRLNDYLAQGGKLLLSGQSGLNPQGHLLFDCGGDTIGQSSYQPDYALWSNSIAPEYLTTPIVMYLPAQRLQLSDGISLGDVYDPYFNRINHRYFCSHKHTPYQPVPSGFAAGTQKGNLMYFAHPVFSIYRGWGSVPLGETLRNAIRLLLASDLSLTSNLPSTARVSLMKQPHQQRYVLHLLYANTVSRGGKMTAGNVKTQEPIDVIEDLIPLHDIRIRLKVRERINKILLVPQQIPLSFKYDDQGFISIDIDAFSCHQMLELDYDHSSTINPNKQDTDR